MPFVSVPFISLCSVVLFFSPHCAFKPYQTTPPIQEVTALREGGVRSEQPSHTLNTCVCLRAHRYASNPLLLW